MLLLLVEEETVKIQEIMRLLEMVQIPNFIHQDIVLILPHSLFVVLEVVVVPLEILLKETGNMMGVTESRACQLTKQAIKRLRFRLRDSVHPA